MVDSYSYFTYISVQLQCLDNKGSNVQSLSNEFFQFKKGTFNYRKQIQVDAKLRGLYITIHRDRTVLYTFNTTVEPQALE